MSLIKLYLNSDKLHLKSNRLMQETAPGGFQIMWEALCRAFDCQPGDILEYVPGEK